MTNWRGSGTAGSIPDAIVGARYLLVRDAANGFVVAPILLDGDAGDHVKTLKKWFAPGTRRNRLTTLMEYVRANKQTVVRSSMCDHSAKRLAVDALSELQNSGYAWKSSDCSLLKRLAAAGLHRDHPIARLLYRGCKRKSK